jgi:glutathione synthase/RimK-type ligase-like ATP-grasp enzyme
MRTIALATHARGPELFGPEAALLPAFRDAGFDARACPWNDPGVDWRAFDAVLIRSTWDYHEQLDAFRAWIDRFAAPGAPRLINPPRLASWNLDKLYLRELEGKGVRILPTEFLERGARADLADLARARGWDRFILKPSVSAGAAHTFRLELATAASHQGALDAILARSAALVQPYFPEIESTGEHSLHFFGGELSHAIVKVPAPSDFRVQFKHGGTFRRVEPSAELLAQVRAVLAALPEEPVYARIDGLLRDGRFHLMEAELLEPYLHFDVAPEGPAKLARAVRDYLGG